MHNAIFFWGHDPVKHGLKACLSNFFESPFVEAQQRFVCSEQYFMHAKAVLFGDQATADAILQESNPVKVKSLGRMVENFDAAVWDAAEGSRAAMTRACMLKFSQNPKLREFLLSTGDRPLVEASPYDALWGIGLHAKAAEKTSPENWPGHNWLGKVLEHVRLQLRSEEFATKGASSVVKDGVGGASVPSKCAVEESVLNEDDSPTPLTRAQSDEYGVGASAYSDIDMAVWKRKGEDLERLFKASQFEDAAVLCEELISIRPDFARAYVCRAKIMEAQGDTPETIIDMLNDGLRNVQEGKQAEQLQAIMMKLKMSVELPDAPLMTKAAADDSATATSNLQTNSINGTSTKSGKGKVSAAIPSFVMLVGLPGSGKSTFASALAASHRSWVVCSQDDVGGSRSKFENGLSAAGKHLARGAARIIVDRVNPKPEDRAFLLGLVHNPADATAVYFDVPSEVCLHRVANRLGHPTIPYGKGQVAVKSMAKAMTPPRAKEKPERFAAVHTICTPDDAAALLSAWGCTELPQVAPAGFFKFPRTHHIHNTGGSAVTRDDLVMDAKEARALFYSGDVQVRVEEKIDGTNIGFSLTSNWEVQVQNRSKFVCSASHTQFKNLDTWLSTHGGDLCAVLGEPERYVLFGEWMYAQHSILYTQLPNVFIAFDLYDKVAGAFASRAVLEAKLDGTGIPIVPLVAHKTFTSLEELMALLDTPSQFRGDGGPLEGVYLKVDRSDHCVARGKLVRADFIHNIEEHWMSKTLVRNTVAY